MTPPRRPGQIEETRKEIAMTKAKKPAAGKGKARSLKPKKETLKDLDAKDKSHAVRGGVALTIFPCRKPS